MEEFKCVICQKLFKTKWNLDRHVKEKACSIKLNNDNIIGSNPALEIIISKLNSTIRKEVFKLEETNQYANNKGEMMDVLCEAMVSSLDEYLRTKDAVNIKEVKKMDSEKKMNDIIENGEANYKKNVSKIKELEGEITINSEFMRIYIQIENFKTMAENIQSSRSLDKSLLHKYTAWDEGEMCDFMEEVQDLTMENLDKFHEISGGRTIAWLDDEFSNETNKIKNLYYAAKNYINRKYVDKLDLFKTSDYFKNIITEKKQIIEQLKNENNKLETNYFIYTDRINKGCGIMLSEECDPNREQNIMEDEERNKRLMAYKKSIAESPETPCN